MKAYFTGFWSGFFEKTNPVHVDFFLALLSKVYGEDVSVGDFETSTVLIENTQVKDSLRQAKQWQQTYLYSGESYIRADREAYDCVLYGERCAGNTINCPLYVPYTYCLNRSFPEPPTRVPLKQVVVCISNPGGPARNRFLELLETQMHLTYIGNYKNNIGGPLSAPYNSQEFFDYVSQFKFMITMENSAQETYITEKLVNGFYGQTLPVYWGAPRVTDYFSKDRFLQVTNDSTSATIAAMKSMTDEEWLTRVQTPVQTEFGNGFTVDSIASEIRNLLFPSPFKNINKVYFLCSSTFEPSRYERLQTLCSALGLQPHNVKFLCPSWKTNVKTHTMLTHVRTQYVQRVRRDPMKRAEVSLFFNWIAVLADIERNYKDGVFMCLESDVFAQDAAVERLALTVAALRPQRQAWSLVHIGGESLDGSEPCGAFVPLPYRDSVNEAALRNEAREDLSGPESPIRFFRHFNTRCTDSFLFSYKGVQQLLTHLTTTDTDYGAPFDYYVTQKCETDFSFKMYWSSSPVFHQASNLGMDQTSIQGVERIEPLRLILFDPGHIKNTNAIAKMCERAGILFETAWLVDRLTRKDYNIVIMNMHYLPPEFFPEGVKIIYGPQHWIIPKGDICGPLEKSFCGNAVFNTLSKWVSAHYNAFSSLKVPQVQFPFSVDLDAFRPESGAEKLYDCILYFKRRSPVHYERIKHMCETKGLKYTVFKYGSYKEDDYMYALKRCKFMIVLDAHESQGFALQEAMATNVPLLVCDVQSMHEETEDGVHFTYDAYIDKSMKATSVPYWDDALCGRRITDLSLLESTVDHMILHWCDYNPRVFIERELGPLPCILRILKYFNL